MDISQVNKLKITSGGSEPINLRNHVESHAKELLPKTLDLATHLFRLDHGQKVNETTTPNRIRKWSPTLLLTGRYPGYLRRSDGMRSFLDSMVVDEICGLGIVLNRSQSFKKWKNH